MTSTTATAAAPRTCSRCGRKLTKSTGNYGPRCAAIVAATEGLNAKQVDKMAQLIEDKAIVATNRKGVYKVVNEAGETIHTAHAAGMCSCAWGLRRDSAEIKTCYHSAAAKLLATPRIRKPAPVLVPVALPASADLWAELDRLTDAFMAIG